MTTPTPGQLDAARRLVANPRSRWMPGMRGFMDGLAKYGFRVVAVHAGNAMCYDESVLAWENADTDVKPGDIPDPNDPATLGCVLALVREAWNDDSIEFQPHPRPGYRMRLFSYRDCVPRGYGDTRFEALVSALEAAPVKDTAKETP